MSSERRSGSQARRLAAIAALASVALVVLVSAAPAPAGTPPESPRRQPRQPRGPVGGEHARDRSATHAVLRSDPAAAPTAGRAVDAASARPPEHPQRLLGRRLGRPPLGGLLHGEHRRDDTEARRQQLLRLRGAVRRRPRVVRRLGYRGRHPESLLEQPGIDDELPRHPVLHRVRDVRWPRQECRRLPAGAFNGDDLYVVYLPVGTTIDNFGINQSCDSFGAYHFMGVTMTLLGGAQVPFAAIPLDCANGDPDELSELVSHEVIEAATDPNVVHGLDRQLEVRYHEPHAALHGGRGRGHLLERRRRAHRSGAARQRRSWSPPTGRTRTTPACRSRRPTSRSAKTDSPDPVNRGRPALLHAHRHEPRAERRARRLCHGHAPCRRSSS